MKKIVCAVLALAMVFSVVATGFVIETSAKPKSTLDKFAEAQDSLFYNGITWAVRGTSMAASVGLLNYTFGASKGAPDYKGLNRGNYYAPGYDEYTANIETFIEAYNEIFGIVVDETDPDKDVKRLTQEKKYKDRSGVNEKYEDYGVTGLRGFTRYVSGIDPELVLDQKAQIYLDENENWIINGKNQSLSDYFGIDADDLAAKFQSWIEYLNGPTKLGETDFAQIQSNWFEMARYGGLWGVKNKEEAYAAFGLNVINGVNPAYDNDYFFKYIYNTEKVNEAVTAMAAWLENKVANSFDFTSEDELVDDQVFGGYYSKIDVGGEWGFPAFAGLGDALTSYSVNAASSKLSAAIVATGKNAGKVNYSGKGKGEGLAGKSIVDLFKNGIDNGEIESEVKAENITGAFLAGKFGEWLAYIKKNYGTWESDLSNLNKTFYQKVVAGDLDILASNPGVWEARTEADLHDIFDIDGEVEFYMWLVNLLEENKLISDGKVLTAVEAYDFDSRVKSVAVKDTLKLDYYKISSDNPYYKVLKDLNLVTEKGYVYSKNPDYYKSQEDYGIRLVNAQLTEFIVYADSLYYFTKRATEENMAADILNGLNAELEICTGIMEKIEEKLKGEVGSGLDKPTGKFTDGTLSGYAAAVQKYVNWISYNAQDASVFTLSAAGDAIEKINPVRLAGKGYIGNAAISEYDKMYTIKELCDLDGDLSYWLTNADDGFITALNDAKSYDGEGELYIDFVDYYKDCIDVNLEGFVDAVQGFFDKKIEASVTSFDNSDNTILCIKSVFNAEPLSIRVDPAPITKDEDKSYLIDNLLGRYFFLFVGGAADTANLSNNKVAIFAGKNDYNGDKTIDWDWGFNAIVGDDNKKKDDLCWFYNYSNWEDYGDEGDGMWNWIVYAYTDVAKVIVDKFVCINEYATNAFETLREFIGQAATIRFYGTTTVKQAWYNEEGRYFWAGKYQKDPNNFYGTLTKSMPKNKSGIFDNDLGEISKSYFSVDAFEAKESIFYRWNEFYPLNVYTFNYKTNSYPPKAPEGVNVYEKICAFIENFASLLNTSGNTTGSANVARLVKKIKELDAFADILIGKDYVDMGVAKEFKALTASAADLIPDDFGAPEVAIYNLAYDAAFGEGFAMLYSNAVEYLKENILKFVDGGESAFNNWEKEVASEATTISAIVDFVDEGKIPTAAPTEAPTAGSEVPTDVVTNLTNRITAIKNLADEFIDRNYIVKENADAFKAIIDDAFKAMPLSYDTTIRDFLEAIEATEASTEAPTEQSTEEVFVDVSVVDNLIDKIKLVERLEKYIVERKCDYITATDVNTFKTAADAAEQAIPSNKEKVTEKDYSDLKDLFDKAVQAFKDNILSKGSEVVFELKYNDLEAIYNKAVRELKEKILFDEGDAAFDAWEIAAKASPDVVAIMPYLGGTDGKYWKYFDIIANTLLHLDTGVVKPTEPASDAKDVTGTTEATQATKVPIEDVTGNAYYGKGMYDYLIGDTLEAFDGVVSWYNAFDLEFNGFDWIYAGKIMSEAKEAVMIRNLVTIKEIGKDKNENPILSISAIDPSVPMSYFFKLREDSLALMEEAETNRTSTIIDDYCADKHKELNNTDAETADLAASIGTVVTALKAYEEYSLVEQGSYSSKTYNSFKSKVDDLGKVLDNHDATLAAIQKAYADAALAKSKLIDGEDPTEAPTQKPTKKPTQKPTEAPTQQPTETPSEIVTETPTTDAPTQGVTENTTNVEATENTTEKLPEKKGCGSVVLSTASVLVFSLSALFVLKKKKE